jgi:hypothetical protein
MKTLVLDWWASEAPETTKTAKTTRDNWGKSKGMNHLRRTIMKLLPDQGTDQRPWADGPTVRALKRDVIRTEFTKSWPATGETEKARRDARWHAYDRAVTEATDKELIVVREIGGEEFIWMASAPPSQAEGHA